MTAKLTIEYDGTAFRGWAKQPGERTVQAELERALQIVRREPTPLTVAGRTDAGVHAWGQVASHAGAPADARSLNALLPDDVAVLASVQAEEGFDARSDAVSRTYCYRVLNRRQRSALLRGRVWWVARPLDRALLEACAGLIVGEHDFRAFTLSQQPYEHYRRRILSAEWLERDGVLEFWIGGESFTRRMVRSLTAFQTEVARGVRTLDDLRALLAGAPRSAAGGTAPAAGLHLASVSFGRERPAGA
jgi:tRNA pseudouridine38-40 synthase